MIWDKTAEIERFIATARVRDFKQALRDADACCESRGAAGREIPMIRGKTLRVTGITPAPYCDCFVCTLAVTLMRRRWDIQQAKR